MIALFRRWYSTSRQTKYFILNTTVYMIAIIASTLYCYARLDYVRSGKKFNKIETQSLSNRINRI